MSQAPTATALGPGNMGSVANSASASEKSATTSPKLRSCVVCRSRKVRCDKLSPCSNCRRANIACVVPSADRPPRWARRLNRVTNTTAASSSAEVTQELDPEAGHVMDRLHKLESLVKELRGQLEQANSSAARSAASGSSGVNSLGNSPIDHNHDAGHDMDTSLAPASTAGIQKQFGKLALRDTGWSRYVSSGFWSRVNDEIDSLKMDTRGPPGDESDISSEDKDSPENTLSTQELERTPSERHAFLFQHNLSPSNPDLRDFHPLPSQIPFLLTVYSENVNVFIQIVHMPTIMKMIRDLRSSDVTSLTPANEALMFSIYYAAVTSMEEDDIITNFGCTKADLNLKYRLGLEHALAKADFLNTPDIVLVQAFAIFLFLVRRHDSPRFVWMMTGLVIRMAQALGLHRDGSQFDHLTPYEVEIRRKVWWAVCLLDLRASEDQGTELTTTSGIFDTKKPLNINDADIEPQTKQTPPERQCFTDMTFTLVSCKIYEVSRRLMTPAVGGETLSSEDQCHLLNEVYETFDRLYLQYSIENENTVYGVAVTVARLVVAKLTLLVYLPVLFSTPNERLSDEIRNKLLVAAIEVAEYNHALNSEKAWRHWRWIFQTYTHWYSIVYLLIETSRRPWSPIVERAWVALHSSWLIPAQSKTDKNMRIKFPLQKLMAKARKHRDTELERLRSDTKLAAQLEMEDKKIPLPASSGPFPAGKSHDLFRGRWRELVAIPNEAAHKTQAHGIPATQAAAPLNGMHAVNTTQQSLGSASMYGEGSIWSNPNFEIPNIAGQSLSNTNTTLNSAMGTFPYSEVPSGQTEDSSYSTLTALPLDWSGGRSIGSNIMPWLWGDADPSVDVLADMDIDIDLDSEVNWYNWVESARGLEQNFGGASNIRS